MFEEKRQLKDDLRGSGMRTRWQPRIASWDARARPGLRLLGVSVLYLTASSALLQAFLTKWSSEIGEQFPTIISYALPRPFAYRVLVPMLVNGVAALIPARAAQAITNMTDALHRNVLALAMVRYGWPGEPEFRIFVLMALLLVSLFATAWMWRALLRWALPGQPFVADIVPALALLAYPLTFSRGGHVYDFTELLFLSASFFALMTRRWAVWYLLLPIAVLNKESSVLMIAWLLALRGRLPPRTWWSHVLASVGVGGLVVVAVWLTFHGNRGGVAEFWLPTNLRFWGSLRWLVRFKDGFATGVPLPSALNIANVLLLGSAVHYGRGVAPPVITSAFFWSVASVVPLFLVFGYKDEVRVFATAIPPLLVLGAGAICALYPSPSSARATGPFGVSLAVSDERAAEEAVGDEGASGREDALGARRRRPSPLSARR